MDSLEQKQDSELIALSIHGSNEAFNVIYGRYRLQLFSYLHKLLPNATDMVEEIFQQTWIKAVRNWDKYSDKQKFLAWLCRIAHNLVMDHYRKKSHMPTVEIEAASGIGAESGSQYDNELLLAALEQAIAELTPEQRTVVELRRQGVDFKEIAARQNANLNTVLGRMHYAVAKLREKLKVFIQGE